MRDTDWQRNQHARGYLPHRTILPLALQRFWDTEIGGPKNPATDGLFAGILKSYQQWRICEDEEWVRDSLVHCKRGIEYAMNVYDSQGDGVIRGEQPNTYDIHLYGPNTFIGTQYLAALRACEIMLPEIAGVCKERFASGS